MVFDLLVKCEKGPLEDKALLPGPALTKKYPRLSFRTPPQYHDLLL